MAYRVIDKETMPRREQFDYFRAMAQPYVGITWELDITDLRRRQKAEGWPFFLTMLYLAGQAANRVPQLRQRIRGEDVVEYDCCDTSHTVATADGNFRYCRVRGGLPFREFLPLARAAHQAAQERPSLREEEDEESLLFVSSVPWTPFTGLIQPTPSPADSNPRITFGGYHWRGERLILPVSLLANHALVDGRHLAQFYQELEKATAELLEQP